MSNSDPLLMPAPVCLIENTDNGLQTVESSLDLLRGIQQPVVVVAVVGLYRTGKSYLMNRLADKQSGFPLGSTIASTTKGIWMWCLPHPAKQGHTLVLLDTEGLCDVDKGDSKNDAWIFCLAVLLSSTLVYNSRGTIDNQAIEKLHYVTELTDQIRVKSTAVSSVDDGGFAEESQFVHFFPDFVWAIRDFTLELKVDGRDISEDEYLEFALQLKKGLNPKVMIYNLPRLCIRNFFPTRKCFAFPLPAAAIKMMNLNSMAETDLDPDFLKAVERFRTYIFAESRVKTVKGHRINGSRFSHLVKIYVDTINSGSIPCLENAVVAMAEIENQLAVNEGFQLYEQGMGNLRQNFPIYLEQLLSEHQRLEAMATKHILKHSFKDEGGKSMIQLQEKIGKFYEQLFSENMEASRRLCRKLLYDLYAQLAVKIQQGSYAKAGGYEMYCRDRDAMVAKYRQHGKKGVKGEEVLEEFLHEKKGDANIIRMTDKRLTEAEKNIREIKIQMEALQNEAQTEKKHRMELERRLERLESVFMEHHIACSSTQIRAELTNVSRGSKGIEEDSSENTYLDQEDLEYVDIRGCWKGERPLSEDINEPTNSCTSCEDIEDTSQWILMEPSMSTDTDVHEYKHRSPPGRFQCKVSGLRWVCTGEVTLQYHFVDPNVFRAELAMLQYEPIGPLMDIKVLSGELLEAHLPHFACLEGSDSSLRDAVRVLHGGDSGVILETCELTRFHAKLHKPSFSLTEVLVKIGIPVKTHLEVLIYRTRVKPLVLLTYVVPRDASMIQAVEKDVSKIQNAKEIKKPRPTIPIWMYTTISLEEPDDESCSSEKSSSHSKISPSEITLKYIRPPEFFEVIIKNTVDCFDLELNSEGQSVWKATVEKFEYSENERDSYSHGMPSAVFKHPRKVIHRAESGEEAASMSNKGISKDFFRKNKLSLETRLPNLDILLNPLVQAKVLNAIEREEIQSKPTDLNKNQCLIKILDRRGTKAQEIFCQILQYEDPYLVEELEENS